MLLEARWALILNALGVVVTLVGGVFGGVLAALNRYDTISGAAIIQTAIRAIGTVLLLRAGYSLVGLALLEVTAAVVANGFQIFRCFQFYPELRLSFGKPRWIALKDVAGYSGYLVLFQAFGYLIAYSPSLVVGATISAGAVALYAIANSLAEGVRQILATITPVFMPLASRLQVEGDHRSLQALLHRGTRLVLIVTLPVLVTLLVRAETFIGVWMGAAYAAPSGEILRILTVATFFAAANSTGYNIVFGLGRQRDGVLWLAAEAAVVLALAAILVQSLGVAGAAWAVTLPHLAIRTLLWPRFVCRLVGVSVAGYFFQSWMRPLAAAIPFSIASLIVDRYWPVESVAAMMLQTCALLPLYAATSALVLWPDFKAAWLTLRRSPSLGSAPAT
jgi:O-antigen/teichoic acid export membrane protein